MKNRMVNEARDRLNHMKKLERTVYKRPLRVMEPFNGHWRKGIVEWMYTITRYCGLKHEAVAAAAYYLDAAVSKGLILSAIDFQVAAMTAFHLGVKVYDSPSIRMVRLESLVKLGSGGFGEKEVLEMETKLLFALDWRMNPPTANCFLYQYLTLLPPYMNPQVRKSIKKTSMNLIERVICTDYYSLMESSLLAHAALLLAVDMVAPNQIDVELVGEFLDNMAEATGIKSGSQTLSRCVLLLDSIANDQPIPWYEADFSSMAAIKTCNEYNFQHPPTQYAPQ